MPAGRPSKFTPELAAEICDVVSTTTSGLKRICENNDAFPNVGTVLRWLNENEEFRNQYARATEVQADLLADEMMEIADDTTGDVMMIRKGDEVVEAENREFINRSRLRVDTRKWIASKLKPKKYGDRTAIDHGGEIAFKQITGMEIITTKPSE